MGFKEGLPYQPWVADLLKKRANGYDNPDALCLPQGPLEYHLDPQPREIIQRPGFANVDMSLVKNQVLTGGTRVQLRLEVFNVLNRANFATPTRPVFAGASQNETPLATAGKVTRTVNASRQVQLGIKVLF